MAEETMVSRAAAYRCFPSAGPLLVEAALAPARRVKPWVIRALVAAAAAARER